MTSVPRLDVITDLGIELKREIPKGQARMKWLRTDKGYREAVSALRGPATQTTCSPVPCPTCPSARSGYP